MKFSMKVLGTIVLVAISALVASCKKPSTESKSEIRSGMGRSTIDGASLNAIARAHANFSVSQHAALQRAIAVQRRQMASTGMLMQLAQNAQLGVRRALAATSPTTQSTADFRGNFTIVGARQSFTVLQRQPDCSLTLAMGAYSFSAATVQISQLTPRYDQLLHGQAGLSTPAGGFAQGCADAGSGLGSSEGAYLGQTTGGAALFAGTGVTSMSNQSSPDR